MFFCLMNFGNFTNQDHCDILLSSLKTKVSIHLGKQIFKSYSWRNEQPDLSQHPRQESGCADAKKLSDALESYMKANFQENIPGNVPFQKKWGDHSPPGRGACKFKKKENRKSCLT